MVIQLKNVSKSYEKTEVIDHLDLTIEDKKFTTLLGPSGCGKTTILRMIAGLEMPTAGEIWFDDTCMFSGEKGINVPAEKRNLGFVFQDFALWPHLNIFENVAFGLRARHDTENLEERVTEALQAVRLAEYKNRYPSQLSGGQQQRVGFARAIVTKPDCILFDEPLSALDAILREEMRGEIKTLTQKMGITAVFVTHDQMEAMSMSDQIVVLNKGKIEQQDGPETLYRRPGTPFVAKFIGKSNWFGNNAMFRPETASLREQKGRKKYSAVVKGIRFLGETYQLSLETEDPAGSGKDWTMETADRYDVGSHVSVFIDENKIIHF